MKSAPHRIYRSFGRTRLRVIVLLIAWVSPTNLFAAGGDLDTTFAPGTGPNGEVRAIAIQADGKIIIGGAFTTYRGFARNRIARLTADGSLDGTFDFRGTGTNDTVYAIALQADGKILIGGAFTTAQGTARSSIARLNPDGSLDTAFDPGTGATGVSREVRGIAIQADNKILIGGAFTSYNGTGRNRIARLNLDGSLDTAFDPGTGASGSVFAVAVQSDGGIIVGGLFTSYNGTARNRVARLNLNGSLDTTFDPGSGADFNVFAVAVQSDGGILIGGLFASYNGVGRNGIARLNSNGSLDNAFDPGTGPGSVYAIAVQPGGKVIIGGFFTTYNGVARTGIARINTNGSLDTSFDPGTGVTAASFVYAVAVQSDGGILIGGTFTSYNGVTRNRIARLLPSPGALAFSGSTNSVNEGAGNATIALTRTGGTDNSVTAKVTMTDGTASPADYLFGPGALDTSFDPGTGVAGGGGYVLAVAAQSDGKVLIGGSFTTYNGVARTGIARINTNGSLDTTFDPGTGVSGSVEDIAVQSDGKVIIGGFFTAFNGVARSNIARLNANGSLDATFDPGTGANSFVLAVAVQSDGKGGKVLIGGLFTAFNGVARSNIARLNANGSLGTTFDPGTGTDDVVRAIAIQADGKVLVGGYFTAYNGVARSAMARINANGSLDTTFDPGTGADGVVHAVAVQSDGKVLIGGQFISYNGVARKCIARLNSNGSLDTTFDPGTGTGTAEVRAIAVQADGKILIGGYFTTYNGVARNSIARLNSSGSLDTTFVPGTGASFGVIAVAVQPDGKVLIGGEFTAYDGVARNSVARVDGDLFVAWPAGDPTDKSIQLPIVDDSAPEGSETLTLALTNLTGGATPGANTTQTLTIIDNDPGPPSIASNPSNQTISPGTTATLSVTASGGGLTYQWYAGTSGTVTSPVGTDSSSYTTPALSSPKKYWVRVSNGFGSADSTTATVSVSFTDSTLTAATTPIKVAHLTELRTRIDAVRGAVGLGGSPWTNPLTAGTTLIHAADITEMRTALDQAYDAAARLRPSYSTSPGGGAPIATADIADLRAAVLAIE